MDFQVGDEQPLPGIDEHETVLTQLESSSQEIHKSLNAILDYQTHHRLREAQGNDILIAIVFVHSLCYEGLLLVKWIVKSRVNSRPFIN